MPKISSSEVRYLALEGGGGKGVAYLGAIKALEEQGILPVAGPDPPDAEEAVPDRARGSVVGVSGASAGAITAFLIALGYDSAVMAKIVSDAETFRGFYDGPDNNKVRHVVGDRFQEGRNHIREEGDDGAPRFRPITNAERQRLMADVRDFPFIEGLLDPDLAGGITVGALGLAGFGPYLESGLEAVGADWQVLDFLDERAWFLGAAGALVGLELLIAWLVRLVPRNALSGAAAEDPALRDLVATLMKNDETFQQYEYNLLFDRGLFPGFAMREFLRDHLATRLADRLAELGAPVDTAEAREEADTMTFADFQRIFEVELAVSGVNVTTHAPALFGPRTTPDFPVVDAVAISSCFPFGFKPVLVTGSADVDDGLWVDGGVLTNLPLHAFDERPDGVLNAGMLGVRLEPGVEIHTRQQGKRPARGRPGFFDILTGHVGGMLGSLMYPSEQGQIRTRAEQDQTIALDTTGLSTLEFVPPPERSHPAIRDAFRRVHGYFGFLFPDSTELDELLSRGSPAADGEGRALP